MAKFKSTSGVAAGAQAVAAQERADAAMRVANTARSTANTAKADADALKVDRDEYLLALQASVQDRANLRSVVTDLQSRVAAQEARVMTPGPKGDAGVQGFKGDTGPAGSAGVAGPAGTTGTQGAAGATGATGPQGATGTQGASGAAGSPGSVLRNGATDGLVLKVWTTRQSSTTTGALSVTLPAGYFASVLAVEVIPVRDSAAATAATFAMVRARSATAVTAQLFESKTNAVLALNVNIEGVEPVAIAVPCDVVVFGI